MTANDLEQLSADELANYLRALRQRVERQVAQQDRMLDDVAAVLEVLEERLRNP